MRKFSDEDIIRELQGRLMAKDRANNALTVMTGRLRALNDRLIESEKLKTHFLSNIRNELNNPLASILTSCEIILSGDGRADPEVPGSVIEMIHKESFNLNFQLSNIFIAAELEAGESASSPTSVDIAALVRSTADSFRRKAVEAGVAIIVELDGINGFFRTDGGKIRCIIANLLSNAIEFGAGKPVEIRACKTGASLSVSVKDRGPGIDACHHGAIFERFKQLDAGSAKAHAGHGLGLSVARALVEVLGGTIAVISGAGEGVEFSVSVPEAPAIEQSAVFSSAGNDFFFEGERF